MTPWIILFVATLNTKLGVIDYQGNTVIPFEHVTLHRYREGRFVGSKYIQAADGEKLRYGAYDEKGNVVIAFEFDELTWFSQGWATGKLHGKAVVIDPNGNILFEGEYDLIEPFSDLGYARVTKNAKQGFIDRNFIEIIPPSYDWSNGYNPYGHWHVKWTANKREALIHAKGIVFEVPEKHVIKIGGIVPGYVATYDDYHRFQCGLFDLRGNIILPHVYQDLDFNLLSIQDSVFDAYNVPMYVCGYNNDLQKSELFLLSDTGSARLQCSYPIIAYGDGIDRFVFGSESNGKKWLGLMNGHCEIIVTPQFEEIYHIHQEGEYVDQPVLFRTLQDGKYGLINADGKELFKPQFPKFNGAGSGLFNIADQVASKVFNMQGEVLFESPNIRVWSRIATTEKDFRAKNADGRYGIYNIAENVWIIEPIYNSLGFPDIIEK